ncbi:hypothetical protein LX64_03123 [Chitinophaga skermanii]|uniref:Uncharacterized protein n=1 Tax=Chitinophaga skermanii TaxID=331697 RepID=A0A327QLM8_9BACT|nr:hypothetical protein LX64_03123 [Chitinophaga skermanii]
MLSPGIIQIVLSKRSCGTVTNVDWRIDNPNYQPGQPGSDEESALYQNEINSSMSK